MSLAWQVENWPAGQQSISHRIMGEYLAKHNVPNEEGIWKDIWCNFSMVPGLPGVSYAVYLWSLPEVFSVSSIT